MTPRYNTSARRVLLLGAAVIGLNLGLWSYLTGGLPATAEAQTVTAHTNGEGKVNAIPVLKSSQTCLAARGLGSGAASPGNYRHGFEIATMGTNGTANSVAIWYTTATNGGSTPGVQPTRAATPQNGMPLEGGVHFIRDCAGLACYQGAITVIALSTSSGPYAVCKDW